MGHTSSTCVKYLKYIKTGLSVVAAQNKFEEKQRTFQGQRLTFLICESYEKKFCTNFVIFKLANWIS